MGIEMIDIKELRIGNEVSYQLNPYKVTGIDPNQVYVYLRNGNDEKHISVKPKYIEPIPLDEKDLIDFGFEKDDFCGMYVAYEIHGIKIIQDTKKNMFFVDNVTGKKLFVDVVHKLKNVIYELSGKELTKK